MVGEIALKERFSKAATLVPLFKGVKIVANNVSRFLGMTLFSEEAFR